jgi:hypothetical protein
VTRYYCAPCDLYLDTPEDAEQHVNEHHDDDNPAEVHASEVTDGSRRASRTVITGTTHSESIEPRECNRM